MLKRKSTLLFTIIILSMIMFILTTTIGLSMQNFKLIKINTSQNSSFQLSDSLLSEALTELEDSLTNAHKEAEEYMKLEKFKETSKWVDFNEKLNELQKEELISIDRKREMVEKAYELEYFERYMLNVFKGEVDKTYSLAIENGELKNTNLSTMGKYSLKDEIMNNIKEINIEQNSDKLYIQVDIQNDTGLLFDNKIILTAYGKKNNYYNTSSLNIKLVEPKKNIIYREKKTINKGLKMNILLDEWALISNGKIIINGNDNIINGDVYGVSGELEGNNTINGDLSIKEELKIKNKTTLEIKNNFLIGGKLDLHREGEVNVKKNVYRLHEKDKKEEGLLNSSNEYNIKYMVENLIDEEFEKIYLKNKFIDDGKNINNSNNNTISNLINYSAVSKVSQNLDPNSFLYISTTNESLKIKDGKYSGIIINKGDVELGNNVEFSGLILSEGNVIIENNNVINYDIDIVKNIIKNTDGLEEILYLRYGKNININTNIKEVSPKDKEKGKGKKNKNKEVIPWEISSGFYIEGDRIYHNGSIYQCRITHMTYGDPNWAPGLAHNLWEYIREYETEQDNKSYEVEYNLNIVENDNILAIESQNIEYEIEKIKMINLLEVIDFFEN